MKLSRVLFLLFFVANFAYAEKFNVSDVRVSGLQRITAGSFFNYMPIKRGSVISDSDYPQVIRELYKTGFFKNIDLSRDGNTLVVEVEERPIIGKVNFTGNNEIKSKDLLAGLAGLGLAEGDTFDDMKLTQVERELLGLYHSRSKFDVIIDATVKPLGSGRVSLDVNFQEGISARIKQINIVGNKAFSEKELLDKIRLTSSKWHSLLTKKDQYSGEKLKADIAVIEDYYFNRGFLDFRVNSTQVSLTDDKRHVYVTINIFEGLPYRIDKNVFTNSSVLSKEQMSSLLTYGIGDYYSREKVRSSQIKLKDALGEKGYAMADVRVMPKLNKNHNDATLTYSISPGRKTYVRRVEFTGNYKTNDEVLRREMRQLESALYNDAKLKRSDERIQRLGYIASVQRRQVPVKGRPDQVDVIYEVKEVSSRSVSAGLGYGSSSGIVFNVGYQTANFLGTGNSFKFDFSTSKSEKNYSVVFTDPYFTVDGVSRTFQLYYNATDESETEIGDWTTDNSGAFVRFGFPVNEYESFSIGAGYRGTKVKTGYSVAPEIASWLSTRSNKFNEFVVDFNWTHDTRDKTIFSTKGSITRLNAEIVTPGSSENYYKLNVRNRTFFQLSDKILFSLRGDISYGDGYGDTKNIPFFRNYYAGGLSTVRGFKSNSLGPRWSNGDIKGGSLRVTGGAELILPLDLGQEDETVRTALFADFGNVYASFDDFDASELRYSAGIYVLWRSPVGPLNLSYAVPLNEKPNDDIERFQFTIGVPL